VKIGPGWPYYARPVPDGPVPDAGDIAALRARQRQLGVPEALEWIHDLMPGLLRIARRAGLRVREAPLMVLGAGRFRVPDPPPGVRVRLLEPGDPGLRGLGAVQHIGFAAPGTDPGPAGPAERDASPAGRSPDELDFLSDRIRRGLTVPAIAEDGEGALACGSHQPVGDVTAIVGIATLPSARRRGLAALVTARLVQDARARGVDMIFLEAEDVAVARIYARLGFERVGTACIAGAA
jgi:GNAT superfamily N-acetyltransferase